MLLSLLIDLLFMCSLPALSKTVYACMKKRTTVSIKGWMNFQYGDRRPIWLKHYRIFDACSRHATTARSKKNYTNFKPLNADPRLCYCKSGIFFRSKCFDWDFRILSYISEYFWILSYIFYADIARMCLTNYCLSHVFGKLILGVVLLNALSEKA